MLVKLLKHEFRQTGRLLLPLLGGGMALTLLTKLLLWLNEVMITRKTEYGGVRMQGNPVIGLVSGISVFLFVLMLLAIVFATMFSAVQRFYKLLGDEGYTWFALPVTPAQHICAKTIAGTVWMLVSIAFFWFSSFVMNLGEKQNFVVSTGFEWYTGNTATLVLTYVLLALCTVAGIVASQWMMYVSCAIGARFSQHRLVGSVGAFFILQTVLQIIGVLLLILFGGYVSNQPEHTLANAISNLMNSDPIAFINIILGVGLVVLVVCGTAFYLFLHRALTKKLNLA